MLASHIARHEITLKHKQQIMKKLERKITQSVSSVMTQKQSSLCPNKMPVRLHIFFQQTVKELIKQSVSFHLCQTDAFCPVISLEKEANSFLTRG